MKKQILIVDDEEDIRDYYSIVLAGEDRDIHTVATGDAALEILRKLSVDLILLDLKMPGMSGTETLRAIRQIDPSVPVYIVTGFQTEFRDRLKRLKEEGISFEVLNKPVQRAELVMAAAGALEGPLKDRTEKVRFFVAARSAFHDKAVADFRALVDGTTSICCKIDVVDILENPIAAYNDGVFMTPTVIRSSGERPRRIIGDISDPVKIAEMLGLI